MMAWLARVVIRYRRDVVRSNLAASFPEKSEREREKIAREFYVYLADIFCESIWSLTRPPKFIRRMGVCRTENPEILDNALALHKGVVILLGHTGNWELMGGLPDYSPYKEPFTSKIGTVAYKTMTNKTSELLFKYIRLANNSASKTGVIASNRILRFIIEHKGEDRIYFFSSDQCPDKNAKYVRTFLNQPAKWSAGGAYIANKFEMPVLYMYIDRRGRGKYRIRYTLIAEDASKTGMDYVINEYIRLLEKDIRSNPSNWLWSHRRWKLKIDENEKDIHRLDGNTVGGALPEGRSANAVKPS
jgi:KDO2-lipid IV(A) lauroyltransferase